MPRSERQQQVDRIAVDILGEKEYQRLREEQAAQADKETLDARKELERRRTRTLFLIFLALGAVVWLLLHFLGP